MSIKMNEDAMQQALTNVQNTSEAATLEGVQSKAVVDVSANVFEKDDCFTLPATMEEMMKYTRKEIYKTLVNREGKHPEGYYVLVWCENSRTGLKSVKRFRPTAITNSFAEYTNNPTEATYLATGKMVQSTNALAVTLRGMNTLYEQLDYLKGKTLKTGEEIVGNAVRTDDKGLPVGLRRRVLHDWSIIEDAPSA